MSGSRNISPQRLRTCIIRSPLRNQNLFGTRAIFCGHDLDIIVMSDLVVFLNESPYFPLNHFIGFGTMGQRKPLVST